MEQHSKTFGTDLRQMKWKVTQTPQPIVEVLLIASSALYAEGLSLLLDKRINEPNHTLKITRTLTPEQILALIERQALASFLKEGNFGLVFISAQATFDRLLGIGREMRRLFPYVPVLWLEMPNDAQKIISCIESGASGFVLENESLDYFCQALLQAMQGEVICSPQTLRYIFEGLANRPLTPIPTLLPSAPDDLPAQPNLTRRETEVLSAIASNLSNRQIADQLSIELPTVKNHVHNILEKLQVSSRREAAILALHYLKAS